jgi:hypothetical protein
LTRLTALLLSSLILLLAGCAETPGGVEYRVGGSFTEDATQADVEDLQRRLAAWGADAAIMESYPLQYQIGGLDGPSCDEVRAMLANRPYIASVGRCQAVAT